MRREASQGWRRARLKYLANLTAGGTPAIDNPSYWAEDGAGTPWVTIADMSSEAHLRTTVRSVTREGLRAARLPVGPPGTLLFAMYASLGTMSTLETHAAWNQAILGIRPRPGIDAAFLRYCLEQLRGRLAGFARSNTQDNLNQINQGQVSNLELWVPELAVQQAVAAFLDRECERIGELLVAEEHLALLGQMAERERVRGDLDTDAGAVPAQKLGWHIEVLAGYAFPSEGFSDGPSAIRLLRGTNVGVGRTDWSESVGWAADDVEPYRRWLLQAGDLVLGLDRPWISGGIRVAELSHQDLPALLLQRVACLRPFSGRLMSAYVRLWMEHERFFADLGSVMTGVSVPHISPGQVAGFRIPVPDLSRQDAIARRAADARASGARMETELGLLGALLAEYRDALITEAVTGKLDVARLSEQQMDESAHAAMEGERPEVLSA